MIGPGTGSVRGFGSGALGCGRDIGEVDARHGASLLRLRR